jgi:hypothetical protein
VALLEGWLKAEPQLTAIAIVGRLAERHPEQFEAAFDRAASAASPAQDRRAKTDR